MELHREDRRAFMREVAVLLQNNANQENAHFHRAMQELERKCWETASRIQQLPPGADASELEKMLNDLVERSINLAILGTKRRIEELQKKLNDIEEDRDNIQRQRVEFFLSAPLPQ